MIKNLLLDMGGVILDVSYQRVIETFKSYGIENFDKVYTQAKQVEIIDLFETLGLKLSDHIIIGNADDFFSFKKSDKWRRLF
jgi:DNA repair protein RadC